MEKYLTPAQVCELIPSMTRSSLGQMRYLGTGPAYVKLNARRVVYAEASVMAWLKAREQTSTRDQIGA